MAGSSRIAAAAELTARAILRGSRDSRVDRELRSPRAQTTTTGFSLIRPSLARSRAARSVQLEMALTKSQEERGRTAAASPATSRGLQWLWQHLSHLRHPHCFECGPIRQSTLDVLLLRGAKLYLSDLITPAQQSDSVFWSRQGKTPVFLVDDFLAQIPPIPAGITFGDLLLGSAGLAPARGAAPIG